MDDDVANLNAEVESLWAKLDLGPAVPVPSAANRQEASWYVEALLDRFRFSHWERGRAEPVTGWLARPDAVQWVLEQSAVAIALNEECRQRGNGGYSRWNWMAPATAMLDRISPEHGSALASRYAQVLTDNPLSEAERRAARHPLPH